MAIQRLTESVILPKEHIKKLPLTECDSKVLVEGVEYAPTDVYRFKVWRLDEKNLNNRIYTEELANYVIKNSPPFTYGYMDHPKDEGSTKDIWAVEKNPQIVVENGKKYLTADCYLVGSYGKGLVKDILNSGAGIGLSSSSLGEVGRDGKVMLDGFEIERFFDFVERPSYSVWGFNEDAVNFSPNPKESINNINNNNLKIQEGNKTMPEKIQESVKKVFSVEEKTFRYSIKNLLKEAEEKDDLEDKQKALEEILQWFEGVDYADDQKKDIESKLEAIDKEIKEYAKKGIKTEELETSVDELKKEKDELVKENEELNKKFEESTEMLDNLKNYANSMKNLYENQKVKANGMISANVLGEQLRKVEDLQKKLESAISFQKKIIEDNKALKQYSLKLSNVLKEAKNIDKARLEQLRVQEQYKKIKEAEAEKAKSDEEEKKAKEDEAKKNEESINIYPEAEEISEYANDQIEAFPEYAPYREQIENCKTMAEAQVFVMRLSSLLEKSVVKKISDTCLRENKVEPKREINYNSRPITSLRRKGQY